VRPFDPADLRFDRRQSGRTKPVLPELSGDRKKVNVARNRRRLASVHPEACHDERPVEALAVVCHEPSVRGDAFTDEIEQRVLVGVVGKQKLGGR